MAWVELHDIEERVEFYELITAMDTEWLNWAGEKLKQKGNK